MRPSQIGYYILLLVLLATGIVGAIGVAKKMPGTYFKNKDIAAKYNNSIGSFLLHMEENLTSNPSSVTDEERKEYETLKNYNKYYNMYMVFTIGGFLGFFLASLILGILGKLTN